VVNTVGAITANVYMLLIIALFSARLMRSPKIERWIGLVSALVIVPLIYLLLSGVQANRSGIYFVWLALMLSFALFELIFDQILRSDFRDTRWAVIAYVVFFFAATGGMIGVASQAGMSWSIATSGVFLIMAVLAFIQRKMTGF
jgi:hypothetical protein